MNKAEALHILENVSDASRLMEGPNSLRLMLRYILEMQPVSTKVIASYTGIPLPVIASARRELEKSGLLIRNSGMEISDQGLDFIKALGISCTPITTILRRPYMLTKEIEVMKDSLQELVNGRPKHNQLLDQSHATIETTLKRVNYMLANDAIEGRDILILGDDDLTSIGIALVAHTFELKVNSINIIDIDGRILKFIEEQISGFKLNVNVFECDVFKNVPENLLNSCDVFITDPPYTLEGFKLFVATSLQLLRKEIGMMGFISFPYGPPALLQLTNQFLVEMGLGIRELIPAFNKYIGADIHGSTTNMIKCTKTNNSFVMPAIDFNHIYTNSRH